MAQPSVESDQAPAPVPAASAARTKRARERARRAAGWIMPEANPAGTVYGIITVGALLAAESAIRDSFAETVSAVAVTIVLYGFAHSYSELLGSRLETPSRLNRQSAMRVIAGYISVIKGATLPLVALLIAWAAGSDQETAVSIALWTAVVSLVVLEVGAGIRARSRPLVVLLDASVGSAMGLAIVALKAIIH